MLNIGWLKSKYAKNNCNNYYFNYHHLLKSGTHTVCILHKKIKERVQLTRTNRSRSVMFVYNSSAVASVQQWTNSSSQYKTSLNTQCYDSIANMKFVG